MPPRLKSIRAKRAAGSAPEEANGSNAPGENVLSEVSGSGSVSTETPARVSTDTTTSASKPKVKPKPAFKPNSAVEAKAKATKDLAGSLEDAAASARRERETTRRPRREMLPRPRVEDTMQPSNLMGNLNPKTSKSSLAGRGGGGGGSGTSGSKSGFGFGGDQMSAIWP
ncbi:hypothetical protein BC830DRAFT_185949 [Chytriomyces sp. MP71]|nr:hypothetical protein BC830DRAFT_185949 [Chytriomyces sp. MP71]